MADENELYSDVAVLAPNNSQVKHIKGFLQNGFPVLRSAVYRRKLDFLVSTVDSMQGRERSFVIIATKRSNLYNHVGFLNDERRLNVSLTRARKFNGLISDSITICQVPQVSAIFNQCKCRLHGSRLMKVSKLQSQTDEHGFMSGNFKFGSVALSRIANAHESDENVEVIIIDPMVDFAELLKDE